MKKKFLLLLLAAVSLMGLQAQVTQINNNNSLEPATLLNNNLAIAFSSIDQYPWVTDATVAGTFPLSNTIKGNGAGVVLNGKYIFSGTSATEGAEIFISDGTMTGTKLIKDIVTGPIGSMSPSDEMTVLNGFVYFIAATPTAGRELWRTDGTEGNTQMVKDIVLGPVGSNDPGEYNLTTAGNYLLFDVKTPAEGNELWRSDGTIGNASLLKDLITGPQSSDPRAFQYFNNMILFSATAADGFQGEVWRTDGTPGGTILLKSNINPGSFLSFFALFHVFNNRAYFLIDDGVNTAGIWSTDGIDATAAHTSFLKDIGGIADLNTFLFINAFNLPGKFIFPVIDVDLVGTGDVTRGDLWESDGTVDGTKLFKSFPIHPEGNPPFIFVNIAFNTASQALTYPLFNGNFFFAANSSAEGYELWITNGDPSAATTHIVKDINTGVPDGIDNGSFFYSSAGLYFAATNGVAGNELWKSDGTSTGTTIVKDINTNLPVNSGSSDPFFDFIVNGKIMFTATDGDDATDTDLFVVDGVFTPLPVKLLDFTVTPKSADAILNWRTSQEINSRDYTVQRSFDGRSFELVGTVAASGTSATGKAYSFIDPGIINSGKSVIYYRLITTDMDGKAAYSPVITLKLNGTGKWNVKLLSNPVLENIRVVLSGVTENVQLSVVDLNGRKLYTKELPALNGQISLPASDLPRGVYTLITETLNERKAIQFVK